jgi:hypothetical protein
MTNVLASGKGLTQRFGSTGRVTLGDEIQIQLFFSVEGVI